ncbi:MAG: peptide-binding protein [Clostridiales bacterium]|nr:peptide-binding protein [Clostridiales bacterium]
MGEITNVKIYVEGAVKLSKKVHVLLLVLLLVAVVTVSCGPKEAVQPTKPLVWGLSADIETLNPILTESSYETDVLNGVFSTLIKVTDELAFIPDLLVDLPEISPDGLTYTFTLRDGVTFHDGVELTAEDVKFTFTMKTAEGNNVPFRLIYNNVDTFTINGPYDFQIRLKELDVNWLQYLAYADASIVPKHIVEPEFIAGGNSLSKGGEFSRNPIGTGPYKFVEWQPTEYISLEAYDGYFRGEPKIKKMVYKIIPDSNTMFVQFNNGEIDVFDSVPDNQYRELLALKEQGMPIEVFNYPGFTYMHASFNMRLPVFQDKAVRQALNYAFPKELYVETVLDNVGSVAHANTPPMSWAYNPDAKQYEYNPAKAEELLDQAGWLPGPDGVRTKDGVRLEFTMTTISGFKIREDFQEIAKQEWEAIGANVSIENLEGPSFGGAIQNNNFDIIIFAWGGGFDPDSKALWHSSQIPDETGEGQNIVGYKNERLDQLLDAGLKETDMNERKNIYMEVQEILSEDVPSIFVYFYNFITAVPSSLQNFRPNPTQANNTWNMYEWEMTDGK